MTRDEAKKELFYSLQFNTIKVGQFIDKIYDSFILPKQQNCTGCKYEFLDSIHEPCVDCKRRILCEDYFESKELKC